MREIELPASAAAKAIRYLRKSSWKNIVRSLIRKGELAACPSLGRITG
jgi:hypothetical protein